MAALAYLLKPRRGETIDPYHDSQMCSVPVLDEGMRMTEVPKCQTCGETLTFLMQLATPYKETVQRTLYLYCCKQHAEESAGWAVIRFSRQVKKEKQHAMSAFDEMNSLTSWVADIDLAPAAAAANNKSAGKHLVNTVETNVSSQRIVVEEDFAVTNDDAENRRYSEKLFEAYRARDRVDVDEEDHMDYTDIRCDISSSSEGGDSDMEPDEIRVDADLLQFQRYVMQRPAAILRYQWNGLPIVLQREHEFNAKCERCGAQCVFEMQLLPNFIKQIEGQIAQKAVMHIGSVLVYTCGNDCDTAGEPVREHTSMMLYG